MKKTLTSLVAAGILASVVGLNLADGGYTERDGLKIGGFAEKDGLIIGGFRSYDLLSGGVTQDANIGPYWEPLKSCGGP